MTEVLVIAAEAAIHFGKGTMAIRQARGACLPIIETSCNGLRLEAAMTSSPVIARLTRAEAISATIRRSRLQAVVGVMTD